MRVFRGGEKKGRGSCIKTVSTNSLIAKKNSREKKLDEKILNAELDVRTILKSEFLYRAYLAKVKEIYLQLTISIKQLSKENLIDLAEKIYQDLAEPSLQPFENDIKQKILEICKKYYVSEDFVSQCLVLPAGEAIKRFKEVAILRLNSQKYKMFLLELEQVYK